MSEPNPERLVTPRDQVYNGEPLWTAAEAAELTRVLRWGSWDERQRALGAMDAADRFRKRKTP